MTTKNKRITKKYLIDFVNEKFKTFEIKEYYVSGVEITRFRDYDIEGGACRLIFTVKEKKNENNFCHFYCFYSIKQIQQHCDIGYELYLKNNSRFGLIREFELDLRKKL